MSSAINASMNSSVIRDIEILPHWTKVLSPELLGKLELDRDDMVGNLSSGNRQKLAILLAVCHHPQLLVLDEPVSDLDPISRAQLLKFLLEVLQEDDRVVLHPSDRVVAGVRIVERA